MPMKFNAFGKIFSIIAMLTLVFALTFAISVTASAEEPEQNEPAIIITAAPAKDFKAVTFTWEAVANTRYCVYVNNVHVAVVTEPSYTLEMKADEVVEIFIDAIDENDATVMIGSFDYKNHTIDTREEDVVKATCLAAGSYTKVTFCSSCKEVLDKEEGLVLDQLEHEYKDTVTKPTCTKEGYTTTTCVNGCDFKEKKDTVPATGHTEVTLPAVEPTCTETGLTEGKKCTVCGKTTKQQNTVDCLDHEWKDATCFEPKTCTVCSETAGKAAGHKFSADPDPKVFIVKEVCEGCGEEGEFLTVQIAPAYKKSIIKYGGFALCVIVIILSIRGLMAPPTTTPWYKRRRRRR